MNLYPKRRRRPVDHDLWCAIDELRKAQMSTQADVDALTAAVNQVSTDVATAQTTLQAEIDKLAAANPALDLSGLTAAVGALDPAVQALDALAPTPGS